MTLQSRRRTYWLLFALSAVLLAAAVATSVLALLDKGAPIFLIEHDAYRVHGFLGARVPSIYLSIADALACCVFSAAACASVLYTFRMTISPEIYFFSFWAVSLSFEALRPASLLIALLGVPEGYLALLDKIYVGTRLFGLAAIFLSGLYAAGMRTEKHFSMLAAGAGMSVALAAMLPVNSGIWGMNLMFRIGYFDMFQGFSIAVFAITAADYCIGAKVHGDPSYYWSALGIAALMAGAQLLKGDISPLFSLLAVPSMGLGCFIFIRKMHAFYLWR